MNVKQMIKVLQALEKEGKGDYDICYLYDEPKCYCAKRPVRDLVTKVTAADPADGKEIHLYQ